MGNSNNNKNILLGLIIFNIIWIFTRKCVRENKLLQNIIVCLIFLILVVAPIAYYLYAIFMM